MGEDQVMATKSVRIDVTPARPTIRSGEGSSVAAPSGGASLGRALADDSGCTPAAPTEAPLSRPEAERLAVLLKAVADPTRLQLLSLIRASEAGEACVCDLTAPVGLSQPTVSHHLKVLVSAGLLRREPRGTWTWYSLVPQRWETLSELLS